MNVKEARTDHKNKKNKCDQEEVDETETETINILEAERRFNIWYDNMNEEREALLNAKVWYTRRIRELESSEEGYRKMVLELKHTTQKLTREIEDLQLEVKVLRIKTKTDSNTKQHHFIQSYKDMSKERDKLKEADRKNDEAIGSLQDEIKILKTFKRDVKLQEQKTQIYALPERKERVVQRNETFESAKRSNGYGMHQPSTNNVLHAKSKTTSRSYASVQSLSKGVEVINNEKDVSRAKMTNVPQSAQSRWK